MAPRKNKNGLAALSLALICGNFNLLVFVFLGLKFNFPIHVAVILTNVLILPIVFLYMEFSGNREVAWKFWRSQPSFVHRWSSVIALLWIGIASFKFLVPAIKKDYYAK